MEAFDPAMHYGPNDAGVSALSITLVVLGIVFGSWLIGAIYGAISAYIEKNFKKDD